MRYLSRQVDPSRSRVLSNKGCLELWLFHFLAHSRPYVELLDDAEDDSVLVNNLCQLIGLLWPSCLCIKRPDCSSHGYLCSVQGQTRVVLTPTLIGVHRAGVVLFHCCAGVMLYQATPTRKVSLGVIYWLVCRATIPCVTTSPLGDSRLLQGKFVI